MDKTNDYDIKQKVFNTIKNERIKKYTNEQKEITEEGLSFIGNFNGKNVLKIESLKNLKLKIEALQKEKPGKIMSYDDRELLVELYSSAIVNFGGKFTPEMKELYDSIKSRCECNPDTIDEEIYLESINRLNNQENLITPDAVGMTGAIGDRKNVIKFMRIENANIENQMIRVKNQKNKYNV